MAIRKWQRWVECRQELWAFVHLRDESLTVDAHIYEGILLDQWTAPLQSLWCLFNHPNIIFSARNSVSKIYQNFFLLSSRLPIDILLCRFASTSADFHKGRQSFAKRPPDRLRQRRRQESIGGRLHWCSSPEHNSPDIHVRLQQGVDAVHYPAEEASIQGLGHGVSHVRGFVHGVGADDGLTSGDHALRGQRLLELLRADAQERRS